MPSGCAPWPTTPTRRLEAAITQGAGFAAVPGYAQGNVDDSAAALARLWSIADAKAP